MDDDEELKEGLMKSMSEPAKPRASVVMPKSKEDQDEDRRQKALSNFRG